MSAQAKTARAVIYLRVSSTQQAETDYDSEGFSIPAQRDACHRKAESLGAEVVQEFLDRGESGTTANRPGLIAMLDRLKAGDINHVIVHKIDRLARNRADDVAIVMQVRAAGAQVVSTSENIDETPSGLLLHGIMSSIAEFYSRNLATEIKKGTTEKARKGGTPFKAPIGYMNIREWVDGREIRTVAIDPERAKLVKLAFTMYATGDYALSDLAAILEAKGLRTRPSRSQPEGVVVGINRLSEMLRNPYYIGIVRYAGKTYPGRHEPIVSDEVFEQVQTILASQRQSGGNAWRHHHYLRGSIFCAECGGRLVYTRANGRGGVYEYFICIARQRRGCSQGHHRVEAVEAAVERHYAMIQLPALQREAIRDAVAGHLRDVEMVAEREVGQARDRLGRLDQQERKLLAAHYADRVSDELFAEEEQRIRRERIAAKELIARLDLQHEPLLPTVEMALTLTENIQAAYCRANPTERRLLNQAFFEALWVDQEEVVGHDLAAPYAQLLADDLRPTRAEAPFPASRAFGGLTTEPGHSGRSWGEKALEFAGIEEPPTFLVGGSKWPKMVAAAGLEPATRGL